MRGSVAKEPRPEGVRHGGRAHRGARVTGVRLLDPVDRQRPDRVDGGLVDALRRDGVTVRASRVAGEPTGRIGVVVTFGGERSFVADRGAADELRATDLRADWFAADLLHLPAYSLIGSPLGDAGRRAIELARGQGALVRLDLASAGPLLAQGRPAARRLLAEAAPDILFSTAGEAEAFLGGYDLTGLLDAAPLAVVKRGAAGAALLSRGMVAALRFEVTTPAFAATDTTGACDALDEDFLAAFTAGPPCTRR